MRMEGLAAGLDLLAVAGFDRRASLAKLDARLRHGLREQAVQVAAMDDVVFGAVAARPYWRVRLRP